MQIVFLTGSGISAESGLATFRGTDGLWENHRFEDVASPTAWARDPTLVLRFYNERRRAVIQAEPNEAHRAIADLEKHAQVRIVTQNVDDLHERAGSTQILHLHGEIRKARSTRDPSLVYSIEGSELQLGDRCELGSQLRPHIVWFGEPVTFIEQAAELVSQSEKLVIVGTSLQVYPAAGLVHYCKPDCEIILIDPNPPQDLQASGRTIRIEKATACQAVPLLCHGWRAIRK